MNTELNKELDDIVKKYNLKSKEGVVVEMFTVGVHRDFLGKNISTNLTKCLVENSKKEGFFISKAECSSLFSTKALVRAGATIEKSIQYEDYTIKGGIFGSDY